jgi:hypothetical protein
MQEKYKRLNKVSEDVFGNVCEAFNTSKDLLVMYKISIK